MQLVRWRRSLSIWASQDVLSYLNVLHGMVHTVITNHIWKHFFSPKYANDLIFVKKHKHNINYNLIRMTLPICHQNRLKSSSNTWHTLFSWLVSYPLFMILCLAALSCQRKVIKKIGATQNCQNILRSSASLHISISHRFTCSCAFDSRNLRLSMYHSFSQLSSSCPATTSHAWFSIRISCASSTVSRMYGLLDRTAGSIHWSDCNKLCAFTSSERLYRRTCDADHTSRLPRSRRGWQKTLVRVDHMATKTSATWYSVYFGQVHACTLVILHACTIAQVHACTLAKVHARAMAKVHACALVIVHLRQMFQ